MEHCPVEIWHRIFSFACTDNGFTGRSLSLVSRYIYQASKQVKWQTISVAGLRQVRGLVSALECTASSGNVRHLFISARAGDPSTASRSVSCDDENTFLAAIFTLLTIISPTVCTLNIYFLFPRRSIFLPFTFPMLVDLTLYGPFPSHCETDDTREQFPSLLHLRLANFNFYPPNIFQLIGRVAPSLTHLHMTGARHMEHALHRDLALALGIAEPQWTMLERDGVIGCLPSTLQKIFVQNGLGTSSSRCHVRPSYCKTGSGSYVERMVRKDNRLVVLKAQVPSLFEVEKEWLSGGDWVENDGM